MQIGDLPVSWLLAAGVFVGILLAWCIHRAVVWWRAWWYRWLGRRGEVGAEALLLGAGYRIVERQNRLGCSYLVDGEAVPYTVRVDFVVEKDGRRYVAEAKNGPAASDPRTPATRRQLLEYSVVYQAHGVLLVDVPGRRIRRVEF